MDGLNSILSMRLMHLAPNEKGPKKCQKMNPKEKSGCSAPRQHPDFLTSLVVGTTGFEPATPASRMRKGYFCKYFETIGKEPHQFDIMKEPSDIDCD
jgi:hypothetical protein